MQSLADIDIANRLRAAVREERALAVYGDGAAAADVWPDWPEVVEVTLGRRAAEQMWYEMLDPEAGLNVHGVSHPLREAAHQRAAKLWAWSRSYGDRCYELAVELWTAGELSTLQIREVCVELGLADSVGRGRCG